MSAFLENFLTEDDRVIAPETGRAVFIGAFGKHPGWDDHIEENDQVRDLGLRTGSLLYVKNLLYVQGFGRNIDTGAWDKLKPSHRLEEIDHAFVWQANGDYIVGRMWSSTDGRGRSRYPMVVVAHVVGVNLRWAVCNLLPRLDQLKHECLVSTTALEVGTALAKAREDCRGMLEHAGRSCPSVTDLLARFARHPQFGPGSEGLLRVLYQLNAETSAFSPRRYNARSDASERSKDLRLPTAARDTEELFTAWTHVTQAFLHRSVPFLLIWPAGKEWIDLIIGEPTPEQIFAVRCTLDQIPRASDIPFNFDGNLRREINERLAQILRGEVEKPVGGMSRWFGSLFKA